MGAAPRPARSYDPRMTFRTLLLLGLGCAPALVGLAACGSDSDTTQQGSGTTSGTTTGQGGGTTSTTTGAGGGTGGAGGGAGGAGGQGTGGTGGGGVGGAGGGPGAFSATIQSMDFFVNCQPIVAPDPVNGSFVANYDNGGAVPVNATITGAVLTMTSGAQTLGWSFDVAPNASGPVQGGAASMVAHTKVPDSGQGTGSPCDFCNGTWSLAVTWNVGGSTVQSTLPDQPAQCAF